MPRISTKAALATSAAISLLWLVASCLLAERFNVPSGDGILYSLPLAAAKHPFDLGIPFLNDFDGYGSSWGHHWPGAMWLRGLIFFALPYSRMADVAVLAMFQLLAAATASCLVWATTRKLWPAAATLILILSDRLLLLACAGNRFESIPVAVVLLLFANSAAGLDRRHAGWRWLMRTLAFLCPTLHPYGLVTGAMILGYDCLAARRQGTSPRECGLRMGAFVLGCVAVAAWFGTQPDALRQFAANLALQKSFYQDWNSVIHGLGNYRAGGGLALWGTGVVAACLLAAGWPALKNGSFVPPGPAWRFLAPTLFASVIAIHTLTRCENFHYLAFGSPFAVMMAGVAAARIPAGTRAVFRWIPAAALSAITAMHGILLPYRILQFKQAGMPDLGAELSAVLRQVPANRTIYIPSLFWPVAIHDRTHEIRWSTFPVASPRQVRERYEREAYAAAKPGDTLIIDNAGARQPDRFGVHPTFAQLPPDPSKWARVADRKLLFPGSIPWGLDLSVYEFREKR